MKRDKRPVLFGAGVVQRLIPHRRPFLFVDAVHDFERGDRPSIRASRLISANESVLDGHFPDFDLWPGVYTIEGLGQSCNLLIVLESVCQQAEERGLPGEKLMEALRQLHLADTLHPGARPVDEHLLQELESGLAGHFGMSVDVNVRLRKPVFPGQTLDYEAVRMHTTGDMLRCRVQACVDGQEVATGEMTSAVRRRWPLRPGVR